MAIFFIIAAVLIRVLSHFDIIPHLPNFAPIAAMALFGGTYLNKKYSLFLVFGTLILSDYMLLYINPFSAEIFNFSKLYSPAALFHSTTLFVYGSFLITALMGIWLKKHKLRLLNLKR